MDLHTSFIEFTRKNQLFNPSDHLILAVSGGADSIVLADLCHRSGFQFSIAHVNYGLRGAESEGDEQFVRDLAKQYGVPCYVQSFDTHSIATSWKKGIQETARELRYNWFRELYQMEKEKYGDKPVVVLTAHHADDQAETLLMNFLKGTGINGLTAIAPRSGTDFPLCRPLLFCRKAAILSYASDRLLQFREDSSNKQSDYTRNYVRNVLIPDMEKVFPEVTSNLLDNVKRFRDIRAVYEEQMEWYRKKLLQKNGAGFRVAVNHVKKIKARQTILFELLRPFGFSPGQAEETEHLLSSSSGKFLSSPTHRVFRNRDWLIITSLAPETSAEILITESEQSVPFGGGVIKLKSKNAITDISADPATAMLDAEKIVYPLLLRKWRPGDYFYPLGMPKKKKISRFLIDQKMSVPDKENVWVIESDKRIIWVVGKRIDHRFRISDPSRRSLILTWKK